MQPQVLIGLLPYRVFNEFIDNDPIFFIIAASYVLTTASLMLMSPVGHKMASNSVSAWRGLAEGFEYLRDNRTIAGLIGLGIFGGLVGLSYATLLPVFADEVFGGDEATYGNLLLGSGVGGLVATLGIVILGKRVRPAMYLTFSGSAFGLLLVFFAQADQLIVAAFALALVGDGELLGTQRCRRDNL